ncbi:MAG TPA: DUF885 family protein [Blastocatellia bacterium]|nr:DUF885 family protein [Blastocatellia bacterium]
MPDHDFDQLHQLASDFWRWRAFHQPNSSDDLPRVERPRSWEPDWSAAAVARQRHALAMFEARWREIDVSTWPVPQRVDYRLIGSALARVRWELDVLRSWERNPRFYVYQSLGQLFEELLRNKPFDHDRSAEVVNCFRRVPGLLADGKANLAETAVRPFAAATLEVLEDIGPRLRKVAHELKPLLAGESAGRLAPGAEEAVTALESFRDWLRERLPAMTEEMAVGCDGYAWFLRHVALMPFTSGQLLAMGRQEWERSVACEAIARERAKGSPELPLFPDQATQMAREEEDEKAIRRFLEENDLLTVPARVRHYRNLPLPAYVEPLAGLGVVDDLTSPTRLDEYGIRYIPQPSPALGYFELSSARDPRPLIVHEGVPGHYFQMSLAWAHEDPIRRHYYDSGPNEGIGFYAEEMLLEAGLFDSSPRTREIIYNFMRLRALRVEVDVRLALGAFSIDEATECLRARAPMDYETARAEAIFFASLPGQAITYQIGKLQIIRFLADARQAMGERFSLRAFHDYLWKNGNIPIALLRWEYLGLEDEVTSLDADQPDTTPGR